MIPETPLPLPLPLVRLTHMQARALQILAQKVHDVPCLWGGTPWRLTLRPRLAPEALPPGPDDWQIALTWSGLPFQLALPRVAAQTWVSARFPDLDLPALAAPFVAAVFEAACDSLVSLLQEGAHGPVRLEALDSNPVEGRSLPCVCSVELRSGEQVLRAQLSTTPQGLQFMADLAESMPPAHNALRVSELPMVLVAAIGMTWLSLDDLGRLKPRDTILFDSCFLGEDGQLWIIQGDWGLRVMRDGFNLKVTEEFMEKRWTAPPQELHDMPSAELNSLEHLPVRLVFDLGEVSMTLGEIQAVQVGQPLPLGRPLSSAVNIRVNGALIGTGELVEIEGELGVTVTSLFQRPAPKPARAARAASRSRQRTAPESQEEIAP